MSIGLTADVDVLGGAGPIVFSGNLKGSFRTVANTAARDAIPASFREAGMFVYSIFDSTVFQLGNDLTSWSTITFGGGGSGAAIQANTAGILSGIDDTTFNDGTLAFVSSYGDYFSLDINDTTTPVSDTVIASFTGKRWLRLNIPSIRWSLVPAWEIDFAAGNDQNSGAPGFPLKTRAELSRRLGRNRTQQNTTVTYLSNHTDPVVLDALCGSGFRFTEQGTTPTVVYSGTVTGYTTPVPAMNIFDSLGDTGVASWTPYLGKVVELTSGANVGSRARIGYDLQGGNIVTSPWRKPTANGALDATDRPPSPGDTYDILNLTEVNYSSIVTNADAADTTGNPSVQTRNISYKGPSLAAVNASPIGGFSAIECNFTNIPFVDTKLTTVLSGVVNGVYMNPSATAEIYCGLVSGFYGLNVSQNGNAFLYGNPLFNAYSGIYVQASSMLEANGLTVLRATAGFLGASGSHITGDPGAAIRFPQKFAGAGDTFYGTTATRRAITLRGCTVTYKTGSAQTAVGSLGGGNVEFITTDTGLQADDTTGTYTPGVSATWGNITTAALQGLHSIQSNGHIVQAT